MRILVTNDDGIYSPSIATLATAASRFGDVRIVAPDVEMSSAGHAITSSRPFTYTRTHIRRCVPCERHARRLRRARHPQLGVS